MLLGHKDDVTDVGWSPDGKRLASSPSTARCGDPELRRPGETQVRRGHTGSVSSVAWSPDGKRLTSLGIRPDAADSDADADTAPAVLDNPPSVVYYAPWSPESKRLVWSSADNVLQVWNAGGAGEPGSLAVALKGHTSAVYTARFSPGRQARRLVLA